MKIYDLEIVDSPSGFVKNKMIKFILSKCDRIEFLVEKDLNFSLWYCFDDEITKIFKNNLIKTYENKAYGMRGTCYLFKLTEEIKKYFIERNNIVSRIDSQVEKGLYFDNPTFYIGEECLISNCSHEGMCDINPLYRKELEERYIKFVKSDPLYFELYQKFKNAETSKFEKEFLILSSLKSYIDENSGVYIYLMPRVECSFEKYCEIAKKYFSEGLTSHITRTTFFGGLFFDNFDDLYYKEIHYLKIISGFDNQVFYVG